MQTNPRSPGEMTLLDDDLPVQFVPALNDLADRLDGDADGAIWDRRIPTGVQTWLDRLAPEMLPQGRFVLAPNLVSTCVAALLRATGIAETPAWQWFRQDAQTLANALSRRFQWQSLRLRLEPVFDNSCAKMHVDNVVARLICTYRGPGTELGTDTTGQSAIASVPTGMPILLKGTKWPAPPHPRLRHRSPQIADTGLSRLVLVLEGVSAEDVLPQHDVVFRGTHDAR